MVSLCCGVTDATMLSYLTPYLAWMHEIGRHRIEKATMKTLPPTDDELVCMEWWDALSEDDRLRWMKFAGDMGRVADAWNERSRCLHCDDFAV